MNALFEAAFLIVFVAIGAVLWLCGFYVFFWWLDRDIRKRIERGEPLDD